MERINENSTTKLWHTSSFLFERTDFRNVIFEKIPWAPSKVAEVKRPQTQNKKILNENPLKIDEIQILALATSKMASATSRILEGAQWIFPKNAF